MKQTKMATSQESHTRTPAQARATTKTAKMAATIKMAVTTKMAGTKNDVNKPKSLQCEFSEKLNTTE